MLHELNENADLKLLLLFQYFTSILIINYINLKTNIIHSFYLLSLNNIGDDLMNGSYYQTPVFINDIERQSSSPTFDIGQYNKDYPMEQSYIENILRNNIGKKVRVHASFADSNEWKDRIFVGIIEHAGRDNLIINDIDNGKYYLILMIYVDFVEFDEEIIYAK